MNSKIVWIRQHLLAAELFEAECHSWEYEVDLDGDGDEVRVTFQPWTAADIDVSLQEINAWSEDPEGPKGSEKSFSNPTFGPPNCSTLDFDFHTKLKHLQFLLNLGEAPFDKKQQSRFLDIIYNKEIFSLHDKDLGYCDCITQTIPMNMEKPVYLPHQMTPRQLQGGVCKCSSNWLQQGVLCPSYSLYTAQVVIVQKT